MEGITKNNATNNKKAFKDYTWIPCCGHCVLSTLQPLISTGHFQGFIKQYLPSTDHQNFHVNSPKNREDISLQEQRLVLVNSLIGNHHRTSANCVCSAGRGQGEVASDAQRPCHYNFRDPERSPRNTQYLH